MMLKAAELKRFVHEAARVLAKDETIGEFEIYCSSGEHRIARLNFTSDIPCRGLEEFKSLEADGFQIRITMKRDAHEVGGASEAGEFTLNAIRTALERAKRATVIDPHFSGFASEPKKLKAAPRDKSDLARVSDAAIANAAWNVLRGAAEEFGKSGAASAAHAGLVIGGDVSVIRDRIAITTSHFDDIRADEGAHFSSSVTALIESRDAKGTASALGSSASAMRTAAASLGRDAIQRALTLGHGVRPSSGEYRVVLGPQPVAEIINYMVMGSLTTGAFHAASSAYQGRFGDEAMNANLSLFDDPNHKAGAARRSITCEGLAARRIDLIRDGKLVGLLSTIYDSHRLETDEERAEKLGPKAEDQVKFPPLNGYRLGEGGGRRFDAHPGTSGTNVVMRTRGGVPESALLEKIGDGIYIGRVWYTYPINGQRAGDFTCTVSGDSYLIRGGKIAEPVAPNSLRVNANIADVFGKPLAFGARSMPAIVWGSPEGYYVPPIALARITLAEVAANP
jgi:PmbA protein